MSDAPGYLEHPFPFPKHSPWMRVFITIVLGIGLLVFALWSRVPGNLPSSFFKTLDRDGDSAVTYAEWKAELQAKSDWSQREWDFHSMDCNADQRVTWPEYRRVVFKGGARCGKNPDIAARPREPGPPAGPTQRLQIPE